MMMKSILTTILTIGCAAGHMMVATPAPRDSKNNPNVQSANINYNLVAPVTQFGCSQFHETAPVVKYTAGQSYSITIEGGASHNGGSCQFGISFGGEQYISLRDDVGSCLIDGLTYTITIPEGTPSGKAVIAWVWINKTGNREYYMNCIDVEIVGGPQSGSLTGRSITVANLPGYPTVPEGDSGIPVTQALYDAEKTITISQGSGGNNVKVETKNGGSGGSSGGKYPTNSTGSAATTVSNAYPTASAAKKVTNAYQTGSPATTAPNAYPTGSAATTVSNAYPTAPSAAATTMSNAYPTSSAATTVPNVYPTVPSASATTPPNAYPVASAVTTVPNAYPTAPSASATTVPNAYPTASAATTMSSAYLTASAAVTSAAYPTTSAAYPAYPTYPVSVYN